jgi:hypothetical protein
LCWNINKSIKNKTNKMTDTKISQLTAAGTLDPDAIIPIVQPDPDNGGQLKNFAVKASEFNNGVRLLGKLTGADMNRAVSATIIYKDETGYPFQVGDMLTDISGATATIASAGPKLTLSNIDTSGGNFMVGDSIQGTLGQIIYSSLSGTFTVGGPNDLITGVTSGATATINADSAGVLTISGIKGIFTAGETIKNGSATAVVSTYSPAATATISQYIINSGDQMIKLSGGSTYIVTDVVITNASTSLTNASGGMIYTGINRTEYQLAFVSLNLNSLVSPSSFFNKENGINLTVTTLGAFGRIGPSPIAPTTVGNLLYFSLGIPQGSSASTDIYVYGYVVN